MDINRIWNNENQLHALTGLKKTEAQDLLEAFIEEVKIKKSKQQGAGGHPAKLDTRDTFVMSMMFIRHYITMEALGALFDLSDSNVKRWFDESKSMLKSLLKKKNYSHLILPESKRKPRMPFKGMEKSTLMEQNNV